MLWGLVSVKQCSLGIKLGNWSEKTNDKDT